MLLSNLKQCQICELEFVLREMMNTNETTALILVNTKLKRVIIQQQYYISSKTRKIHVSLPSVNN
jgi:hypothetical protein